MKRALAVAALLAAFAAPAFCADAKSASKPGAVNYRVSFKMKTETLSAASSFLMAAEGQAKFVQTGEDPHEFDNAQAAGGVGVEYKKVMALVNCVISRAKDGLVQGDFQFELSGPVAPVGKRKMAPLRIFQYATPLVARLGQTVVVVDDADRRIEIRIDEVKP